MSGTDAVREDRFSSRVPPRGSVLRWRHQGMTHVAVHTGPVHGFEPDRTWRIAGREAPSQWEHVQRQGFFESLGCSTVVIALASGAAGIVLAIGELVRALA